MRKLTGLVVGMLAATTGWPRSTRETQTTRPPHAEALWQAQLAMIEGSLGGGRWAHPFYWAGYALFGDPSR